jgi:hypothetical protein
MVNLLGFADIIGIERAAFYGAPGERSIHRGEHARSPDRTTATLQKSHIFSLQLICDWGKTWRGIEP